jgi:hypothetical protein
LDFVSQSIGKRNGFPYPIGCSVSWFLLLHASKCQTLYDGLLWGQVPITLLRAQVLLFQQRRVCTR